MLVQKVLQARKGELAKTYGLVLEAYLTRASPPRTIDASAPSVRLFATSIHEPKITRWLRAITKCLGPVFDNGDLPESRRRPRSLPPRWFLVQKPTNW